MCWRWTERCVRDRLGGWRHHRRAPVRAHPDAGRGVPGFTGSTSQSIAVTIADGDGALAAMMRAKTLRGGSLTLRELIGPTLEPLGFGYNQIVAAQLVAGQIKITAEPAIRSWGLACPDTFGPTCRYRSTAQCPYVGSCNKSWTNCASLFQTDIFGGFRFLPQVGATITFRDGGTTAGGARPPRKRLPRS